MEKQIADLAALVQKQSQQMQTLQSGGVMLNPGFCTPEYLGLASHNANHLKNFHKMVNDAARKLTIEEIEQKLINEGGFH